MSVATSVVHGGISRITLESCEPAFDGLTFGDVGEYQLLRGKAYGSIDPENPANNGLAYVELAPRNEAGLIDYSMDFGILRPADSSRANGRTLYEMINRGAPLCFEQLNAGSLTDPGNGFLMRQGYEVAWSAWQPEANPHTAEYKASFPRVGEADGSPLVRKSLESFVPDTPQSSNRHELADNLLRADISYEPISLTPADAGVSLTVRKRFDDRPVELDTSAVTFLSGRRVEIDLTQAFAQGFDVGAIIELAYDATEPWVGGVGFVSIRDLVSHLRRVPIGATGGPDPSRATPKAVYAWGYSQAGRLVRDFIWQGFNRDLAGHKVFDGMHALVAGAKLTDHNPAPGHPFAQTSRWIRQHEERSYPGCDFPFSYATVHDPLTGKTDGILARSQANGTAPKLFHVDSDFEIWSGASWLITTGITGEPLELPEDVRAYMISGQSHGPGNGISHPLGPCTLGSNPLDGAPVYRALIVAMDRWVTAGVAPPSSAFPRVDDGTLQSLENAANAWPRIPGVPFSDCMLFPAVADYTLVPPCFGERYPVLVPTTDRFGNPEGGVVVPDIAAPLGTYLGRNFRKPGHAEGELGGVPYGGGFAPLSLVAQDPAIDSRPSVAELYPGGEQQYRSERQRAIEILIRRGLVLPEELESYRDSTPFPAQTALLSENQTDNQEI